MSSNDMCKRKLLKDTLTHIHHALTHLHQTHLTRPDTKRYLRETSPTIVLISTFPNLLTTSVPGPY